MKLRYYQKSVLYELATVPWLVLLYKLWKYHKQFMSEMYALKWRLLNHWWCSTRVIQKRELIRYLEGMVIKGASVLHVHQRITYKCFQDCAACIFIYDISRRWNKIVFTVSNRLLNLAIFVCCSFQGISNSNTFKFFAWTGQN